MYCLIGAASNVSNTQCRARGSCSVELEATATFVDPADSKFSNHWLHPTNMFVLDRGVQSALLVSPVNACKNLGGPV